MHNDTYIISAWHMLHSQYEKAFIMIHRSWVEICDANNIQRDMQNMYCVKLYITWSSKKKQPYGHSTCRSLSWSVSDMLFLPLLRKRTRKPAKSMCYRQSHLFSPAANTCLHSLLIYCFESPHNSNWIDLNLWGLLRL